jgi:hypothetical protein
MKHLILFSLLLTAQFVYSQTKYSNGFSDGYNKGYCYGKAVGCLAGVIPSTPIPKIGESYENYIDGYNTGFLLGKNASDQQTLILPPQEIPNNDFLIRPKQSETPLFKPDFQFYQRMLDNIQQQSSTTQKSPFKLSENDREVIRELHDPNRKKQQTQYISFLHNYYTQQNMLPSHLPDGGYIATKILGLNTVDTVVVEVKSNHIAKVTEINPFSKQNDFTVDVNDYPSYKDVTIIDVIRQPVNIINGKAKYSPETFQKSTGIFYPNNDLIYELYFLDYIAYYQQGQKKFLEIKKEYQAKTKYPSIQDGWVLCYVTDGEAFCSVRKVYVQSGKITKYKTGQGIDCYISSGGTIVNGRSNISYYAKDSNGNENMLVMAIYFL